jgi:thioesterase domain-containing protein
MNDKLKAIGNLSPEQKRILLARLLQKKANAPTLPSFLIPIQPLGSKPPLFCIHALGGSVLTYIGLASYLGSQRPLYGIQAPGYEGEMEPLVQVEVMAARYLDAVRLVQTEGPYLFCGLSFGGIVALEMAQQLYRREGEKAVLVLFDSILPTSNPQPLDEHPFYTIARQIESSNVEDAAVWGELARAIAMLLHLFQLELPISASEMERRSPEERVTALMEVMRIANLLPPDIGGRDIPRYLGILQANLQAARNYVPKQYPGSAILVKASAGHSPDLEDPQLTWGKLITGGLEIYEVPGNHMSLMTKQNIKPIVDCLLPYLERNG